MSFLLALKPESLRDTLFDPSTWMVFIANILMIAFAVQYNWNLLHFMWVFLAQSLIISFFLIFKNLRVAKIQFYFFKERRFNKMMDSFGFLIGFFFIYSWFFFFLRALSEKNAFDYSSELFGIQLSISLFFVTHLISFILNWNKIPMERTQAMFARSFKRLAIITLFLFSLGFLANYKGIYTSMLFLVFLLLIKTAFDIFSHALEHEKKKNTEIIKLESDLPGVGAQ